MDLYNNVQCLFVCSELFSPYSSGPDMSLFAGVSKEVLMRRVVLALVTVGALAAASARAAYAP
jgi:hypothetical protein